MNDERDRLNRLTDEAAGGRGLRLSGADGYVDAARIAEGITGIRTDRYRDLFHAYLSGWDSAMATRTEEIFEENQQLHDMVLELCMRMCTRMCPKCRGRRLQDSNNEPCETCLGEGWVDSPPGEAERMVRDAVDKVRGPKEH